MLSLLLHDALSSCCFYFVFVAHSATSDIYTLSLHDALPIFHVVNFALYLADLFCFEVFLRGLLAVRRTASNPCKKTDRKSTRLNSSHSQISYAFFCLKKKQK